MSVNDDQERVLTVRKRDGLIVFLDGCDEYYKYTQTPEEAVETLTELINWIKKQ